MVSIGRVSAPVCLPIMGNSPTIGIRSANIEAINRIRSERYRGVQRESDVAARTNIVRVLVAKRREVAGITI